MSKDSHPKFSDAFKVKIKNGKFSLKGSLNENRSADLYQFRFTNRSRFDVAFNQFPGNVELTLFNRKGKVIAISNEDDGKPEFIRKFVNSGVYFLQVKRISGEIKYKVKSSIKEFAGNTFASALRIRTTSTSTTTGSAAPATYSYTGELGSTGVGNTAFYQFQVSDRSTFLGLLSGLKVDADIELLNGDRQVILTSTSTGVTSELLNQVLDAGTYFLKVKVKNGSTKYNLKLGFNSFTTNLVNISDPAKIITLGTSSTVSNQYVGSVALDNFYKVNVDTPSNLNLVLGGLSADANLQLLGSDGTVLAGSSNTGTTQDLLNLNLKAGTYYVRVLPGAGGLPTPYNLNVTMGALKLFGLTDNNRVVAFNPDKLDQAVDLSVTGLAAGETLKDIDFRPATQQLYGFSSASKLYTIDLKTGAATAVGSALSPTLTGTVPGIDFNPSVDRLRLVSDADENLRLVPTTGTLAATDTKLTYAATDTKVGSDPVVTAVAYSSNFAGTPTTTLYGIDTTLDTLVRQGDLNGAPLSPNTGSLFTIGALGVDFAAGAGFDILTDSSATNTAYATSGSSLYSINLTTGTATLVGSVALASQTQTVATTGTLTSPTTPPPTSTTSSTPLNLIGLAGRV